MKTTLGLIVLFFVGLLLSHRLYAEPAPAAPGTSGGQDSKRPPAAPSDAATSNAAPAHPDSKKDATKPSASPTSATTPGAPTSSKTPQKDNEAENKGAGLPAPSSIR